MALLCFACGRREARQVSTSENIAAKKSLEGIWLDNDGEDVAFRIKGDTVYFPDSTSAPAYFRIEKDSFVVIGENVVKYHILKQTPHTFVFVNQNGEHIKLFKTTDSSYLDMFAEKKELHVTQNKVVSKDTVMYFSNEKYHCYVQINPTTYKVRKASYNEDGVEVDNVYYDNIINLGVYNGARKVFSSDLRKEMFKKEVSGDFLKKSVFSDMTFDKGDAEGLHFFAILVIPETSISYMVEMIVGYNGKVIKRIKK